MTRGAYDAKAIGTQLGGTLRRPASERTLANKEEAVSYGAYRALVDLFAFDKPLFDAQMKSLGHDPNDDSTDVTTPPGIGNLACAAVLNFRHHDGSNQLGDLHPGVRYAWQSNPAATLFNGDGLPAAPFRTDDWPGKTESHRPY
jgi:hypothetical protein